VTAVQGPLDADVEAQIGQWRGYLTRHRAISANDVDELETHLRDQMGDLARSGLAPDEAFLVSVKRLGGLDEVSREFAREHSERLWKQLVLAPAGEQSSSVEGRRELAVVLGLGVAAGLAIKLPALLGVAIEEDPGFYARNLSLFVLPFLAAYFAWKRRMPPRQGAALLVPPFLAAGVVANVYPFAASGATEVLTALHLPVALWLVVGVAYAGGQWRAPARRMDLIRFTGEWVVYYTLLALGGGVLVGLTLAGFGLLGLDASQVVAEWVLPCGAMGAVLVAAWLVESKQSVVENIAPVLTRVFTPLTTLMLVAFLVAILAGGDIVDAERELLILVDLMLVLVLGLLLYAVSARDPDVPAGAFDRLQLGLVATALAVDVLMLSVMAARIAEFGLTPNKAAALGLNLVLLVNLAWSARLLGGFLRQRVPLRALERWQTDYLPVYAVWAAVVVVAFPPVFGFV
jgi:hypothetical protein